MSARRDGMAFMLAAGFGMGAGIWWWSEPDGDSASQAPAPFVRAPARALSRSIPAPAAQPAPEQDLIEPANLEARELVALEERIRGSAIPWDDTVPRGARPDAVRSYFEEVASEGVEVWEIRCDQYPCVVAATHPMSMDLKGEVLQRARAEHQYINVDGLGPVEAYSGRQDGEVLSILAVYGDDLPISDPFVLGEIMGMISEINRPVSADSAEAGSPIHTGDGWPEGGRKQVP